MTKLMSNSDSTAKSYYHPHEVAAMLGQTPRTVANMFDRGELSGWRTPKQDRRVSRASLLRWAIANKCHIPQIGMYPYSIVTLQLDPQVAEAVSRAAEKSDAVMSKAESPAELGIMVATGENCCAVVDLSIGIVPSREIVRAVRRWDATEKMLLIAIGGEDVQADQVIQSGYDQVFCRPLNPSVIVRRIAKEARTYQERQHARHRHSVG